jgi:hypothetical protein
VSAVVRSGWAKLPPTTPCRPNTGKDHVRLPDRGTTQGSHSRAESKYEGADRVPRISARTNGWEGFPALNDLGRGVKLTAYV